MAEGIWILSAVFSRLLPANIPNPAGSGRTGLTSRTRSSRPDRRRPVQRIGSRHSDDWCSRNTVPCTKCFVASLPNALLSVNPPATGCFALGFIGRSHFAILVDWILTGMDGSTRKYFPPLCSYSNCDMLKIPSFFGRTRKGLSWAFQPLYPTPLYRLFLKVHPPLVTSK